MTRKELADLITFKLVAKATIPNTHDFWQLRAELVDALWPVLAQVWENGYIEGANDQTNGDLDTSELTSNPYSEIDR